MKLASIDNMRVNGIFYDEDNNIPEGTYLNFVLAFSSTPPGSITNLKYVYVCFSFNLYRASHLYSTSK